MSKSTSVNEYGFTPFANGGCQNLLSQQEWVHTLCYWKMSKSTTVKEYGFTPANARSQSLLQTKSMGSHPLMVDVKVYYSQQE